MASRGSAVDSDYTEDWTKGPSREIPFERGYSNPINVYMRKVLQGDIDNIFAPLKFINGKASIGKTHNTMFDQNGAILQ